MTATAILAPVQFCKKCQCETERCADGHCKPCKKALDAARYIAKLEKIKARNAVYRESHRDSARAYSVAYRAANPEAKRIQNQTRRANELRVGGKLSRGLSGKLFKLQKGKCPCCGFALGKNFHMDHIIPLSRGGSNTDENMQLLRSRCNQQKTNLHPVDFMQSRGFLL